MKEFIFNDCGICTNPNRYGIDWRNEIKTALRPDGKWVFGWNYNFDTPDQEGGCYGCSLINRETFDTERDACMAGISYLRKVASRRFIQGHRGRASIDACCDKIFDQWNQLTLF